MSTPHHTRDVLTLHQCRVENKGRREERPYKKGMKRNQGPSRGSTNTFSRRSSGTVKVGRQLRRYDVSTPDDIGLEYLSVLDSKFQSL